MTTGSDSTPPQADSSADEKERYRRLRFDFSPEGFKRFQALKKLAKKSSSGEVVRDALALFEWVLDQRAKGKKLRVVSADGKVREVELVLEY